jgi:hypothetical protein
LPDAENADYQQYPSGTFTRLPQIGTLGRTVFRYSLIEMHRAASSSGSLFDIRATENRSIEYVREPRMRRTWEKVITLVDDERSETYATLDEAIRATQTWYLALAGGKLPIWNYSVETLPDLRRAVGHYKSQIAMALGCSSSRLKLRVESPAGSWFIRR